MKMLNIKVDGTFSFVTEDREGASDTSDDRLSAADVRLIQDEIDTLQAHSLYEIHLEKGPLNTFVHKVGVDKFIEESDPDAYNVFQALDQWGPALAWD